MDQEWITVTQAGKQTGIPVETIRRYIRNHSHHLKIRKQGRKYMIHAESVKAFEIMRTAYNDGQDIQEVDQTLSARGIPEIVDIDPDQAQAYDERLADIVDKLDRQEQFNKKLLDKMDKQEQTIRAMIQERDQKLIQAIDKPQEEQNRGILGRLFKRRPKGPGNN